MICKQCGQAIPEDSAVCPSCGAAAPLDSEGLENSIHPSEDAEVRPDQDSVFESLDAKAPDDADPDMPDTKEEPLDPISESDFPDNEDSPATESGNSSVVKKSSKKRIAVTITAVTLAVAVFVAAIMLILVPQLPKSAASKVIVAECGDFTLSNDEFNYYYQREYYYFLSNYGDYIAYLFDPSLPLDEQEYQDGETWQDYFINSALENMQQTMTLVFEAEKAGFTMPEDYQADLDNTIEGLETYAIDSGYSSTEDYLIEYYGPGSTLDTFKKYLEYSYFASAYSQFIYTGFSYTDDEIDAYYDLYQADYESSGIEKVDTPMVNVRHILICPGTDENGESTDEDWAAASQKAQDLYQQWQDGDRTEASFSELAMLNSEDGGSASTGGLYEDVYPGEMVTEFNDWCFDESHQVGDTGIVETTYGYHIMYFCGYSDQVYWQNCVISDMQYDDYANWYAAVAENYTIDISTENISITLQDDVSTDSTQS